MTKLIKGEAYILRTCSADMTSHGGFVWPKSGMVEAQDWIENSNCGGGLHGFLWGEGSGVHADWSPSAVWIVAKVAEWVDLGGTVKFPRAEVVFCGSRLDATNKIIELGAKGAVIGASVNSGDHGTSISGYLGTSTSRRHGASTCGAYGASISGDNGTSTSGYHGTSISGCHGTSTSCDSGTSISGNYGTSISGYGGTSTSGYRGTSISGYRGASTSGDSGTIIIKYHDGERYRVKVGCIGEDGLKPDTPYKVIDGEFVETKQ